MGNAEYMGIAALNITEGISILEIQHEGFFGINPCLSSHGYAW